jgi:hypothetical protein
MTRLSYDGCVDARTDEVKRVLDRYFIEVVEAYNLCPWAAAARKNGEVGVEVLFGAPDASECVEAARTALARPGVRVAMIVIPELGPTSADLRRIRDAITKRVDGVGVADFHPNAKLDLESAGRAVPFCRRSPDPLLQAVPLKILDAIRAAGTPPPQDRAKQLAMLGGYVASPRADLADKIAEDNLETLLEHHAAVQATLDDIAADRAAAYQRVGISLAYG